LPGAPANAAVIGRPVSEGVAGRPGERRRDRPAGVGELVLPAQPDRDVELALVAEADGAPEIGADVFHVSIAGKAVTAMLAPPTAIQAIVSLAARPTFGAPLRSAKSPGDSLVKNLH
jgi:hypothetical protein